MRGLQRIRASGAFQLPPATLCPFLYQTRTIQTVINEDKKSSPASAERTLTFLQQKGREVEAKKSKKSSLTASEREVFMSIQKKFGARLDGVPLPPQAVPSEPEAPSDTTTTTQKSSRNQLPSSDPVFVHATNRNVKHILSLFAPEESSQPYTTFIPPTESSTPYTDLSAPIPSPQTIRDAALQSLRSMSNSLKTALSSTSSPPDHAVWHVLETEVFSLITLLQLQRTSPTTNPYQRALSSIRSTSLPPSLATLPSSTPLLPLITILYPSATLLALHTYIASLPSSGFTLALLPKIRSLGPASYLLAGNTQFFNALMYLYWTVYSDLRMVQDLLAEMKKNGVEYDLGTVELIEEMRREREDDIRGLSKGGRGAQWWALRNQREGWGRLLWRYRTDVLDDKKENKEGDVDVNGEDFVEDGEDLEVR